MQYNINNNTRLTKEVCELCTRKVQIGQPTAVCDKCDKIFHGKCAKLHNFTGNHGMIYCGSCMSQHDLIRYDPFSELLEHDTDSDKFYDNVSPDLADSLENISKILKDCKGYSKIQFSETLKSLEQTYQSNGRSDTTGLFSTYFLNIDGNLSNFDQFVTEIQSMDYEFDAIGLAETNIDAEHKDLYKVSDSYSSVYQSKLGGKKKGSGIGLYINSKYTFETLDDLSMCTPDIECLFVSITNTTDPYTLGVVYRSPNGNMQSFNNHIIDILTRLPDKNTFIMGDFNINLHNEMK